MNKLKLFIFLLIFTSCSPSVVEYYIPPDNYTTLDFSTLEIDKSKDSAWTLLLNHLTNSNLMIQSSNKETGLITLDVETNSPETYITGGKIKASFGENSMLFDGDFVDYLQLYSSHYPGQEQKFNAFGNVVITELTSNRSRININFRYQYSINFEYHDGAVYVPISEEWIFTTNKPDEHLPVGKINVGGNKIRFASKMKAEYDVISAFSSLPQVKDFDIIIDTENAKKAIITLVNGTIYEAYIIGENNSTVIFTKNLDDNGKRGKLYKKHIKEIQYLNN